MALPISMRRRQARTMGTEDNWVPITNPGVKGPPAGNYANGTSQLATWARIVAPLFRGN